MRGFLRWVRRAPRGAAAVEFAIVLPVLLTVVLGTIDWGHYFLVREIVVNASREGARAGTLAPPDAGALEVQAAAEAAAKRYLITAALTNEAVVTVTPTAASVLVEVVYDVGSITGFLDDVMPESVRARAEMRR